MPQRPSVAYAVYANGVLASSSYQPISMMESAGAHRLDHATLEFVWSQAEFGLPGFEDFDPTAFLNTEIEIVRIFNGQVVHWGKVTQLPTLISGDSGETLEMVSRAEIYLLGDPVDGYLVWDPVAAAAVFIDGDLVFNPMIDGVIYGNLNDTHVTGAGCLLFLDPESVRTSAAQTLQGANVTHWSLSQAVFYLLWSLNTPQTNIANPDAATLNAVFNDTTALVQEVRIPRGTHLAKALDLLIEPLGYRWRIKRTEVGARTYEFFKKGTGGTLRSVYLQRIGDTLSNPRNLGETNVETAGITFDIANLANDIRVHGGFEEYEITVELARGWKTASDPTGTSAESDYFNSPENTNFDNVRDVLRKWVLNEAGDYIGSRTEITGLFTTTFAGQLSGLSLLTHFVGRRRKLMPTLTQKAAVTSSVHDLVPIGDLNGVEVEYSITASPVWLPLHTDCSLLEQEAGLYFHGEHLPPEFFIDVPNLRIRVTATIQGDYRLFGHVARQANSPNADVVPLILDLPDRFRYRVRQSSLSKYGGGALPSSAVDDSTAIQNFAASVRNVFDLMDMSGPIQLEGLDNDLYSVGDRIEKIDTKNVSFIARTEADPMTNPLQYPQVIAIERDIESQLITLHLERQRDVIQLPPAAKGNTPQFRERRSSRSVV